MGTEEHTGRCGPILSKVHIEQFLFFKPKIVNEQPEKLSQHQDTNQFNHNHVHVRDLQTVVFPG